MKPAEYMWIEKGWLLKFGFASFLLFGILFLLWNCSTKNLMGTEKVGSIFVSSNVPGATIELDEKPTGKQTPDTLKNIPVGKHKVTVRKKGYNSNPESDTVEVIKGDLTTVNFFLVNQVGTISVNSDPPGATIILDQVNTQIITPDTLDSVPVGRHIVTVEKEGYKPSPGFDTVEVVEDSLIIVDFVLVQRLGDVFVNSNISGAEIILDYVSTGKMTPDTIFDVMIGKHILSITKSGYSVFPESAMVQVVEGSVTSVNFVLAQNVGGLFVNSTPQEAEIYLNQENSGELTPHLFSLPEGVYVVSVTKFGYSAFPESVSVQVIKNSTVTVDFTLTPKKGSIFVNSVPPGGNIILEHAFTGEITPDTLFDINVGDHVVSVEKSGYLSSPESLIVTVFDNQTSSAEFILLDTLYGSLSVSSNPSGATIVIDNHATDKTTPYLFLNNAPIGTDVVSVFKPGYSNDPPAKEVVNITTGDTVVVNFNLSPATVGPDTEGQLSPDFELLDDYNDSIKFYNYRGFVVIVNFWAKSCPFCLLELPFLQEQYNKYSIDSLKIFAVNYEDGLAYIQQKRAELNLTYNLLIGKGSQMLKDYHLTPHVTSTPITNIINRSGLIYCWVQGYSPGSPFETEMLNALFKLFGH
jgi:peroxiredoxin